MPADGELERHDDRGRAQRRVHVAVALADDRHLGAAAGRELGRLGLRGQQHGQLLDLHADEVGSVLGGIGIAREHRRHRLADIAHAPAREHGLAVGLERRDAALAEIDGRQIRNVGRGPHRHHARQRARGRGIDRHDVAVRMVRAHHAHMKLVGKRNVAGKAAGAPHQRRILQPQHRPADPFAACGHDAQ